jgi:hypothetical protein
MKADSFESNNDVATGKKNSQKKKEEKGTCNCK